MLTDVTFAIPSEALVGIEGEIEVRGTIGYRDAGQCSALQGGGEGQRWEGRQARAVL